MSDPTPSPTSASTVSSAEEVAIRASGLRKTFRETVAVDGLDLSVSRGEIFGLVGPDGAGKTTTFRLLLGLMVADAGEVTIGGFPVPARAREAREVAGYVAQGFALYGDLTVAENMRFVAEIRGLEAKASRDRAGELLEWTGLTPFTDRLANNLSGGMKRKLALLCAMLHRPRILLLDEPTTGVDPVSRRDFWRMLYRLPSEGVTLLVSTPYLDEAERCHRLGFMVGGKLLAVDAPGRFLAKMPDLLLEIRTDSRPRAMRWLEKRPEIRWVDTAGETLRVAGDPGKIQDQGAALKRGLEDAGISIVSIAPLASTLSDVFNSLSDRRSERS